MVHLASSARVPRSLRTNRLTLAYWPAKPWSVTKSCQIAIALRPRPAPSSISSRYGSQALAAGARPGRIGHGGGPVESVDTSLAGFAQPLESVDTSLAGFAEPPESVDTSLAGF